MDKNFRNKTPTGLTILQDGYAAELRPDADWYGWLFVKGPEVDQWISSRKLKDFEIMQAEDQEYYGIVINPKVREG